MTRHSYSRTVQTSVWSTLVVLSLSVAPARGQTKADDDASSQASPAPVGAEQLSESALQQIHAIIADKQARSPEQRKISSHLLYTARVRKGLRAAGSMQTFRSRVPEAPDGRVDVEIRGQVTKALVEAIEKVGGQILYGRSSGPGVRALVPWGSLETLAGLSEVRGIRASPRAITHKELHNGAPPASLGIPSRRGPLEPGGELFRTRLRSAVDQLAARSAEPRSVPVQLAASGAATSEGDVAHRAAEARNFFGLTGAGVKIGVLSDNVFHLAESQASGDLPADVTVLPGQEGPPDGSGEGTAMLEIVHDLAPGATLFFATAFNGEQSFADNIRALRAAGCDIIVDDVTYSDESPFQDTIVAAAVNDVTAQGALYFSSAGNDGNFNDGTSSVWEGDFKVARGTIPILAGAGDLHDFGSGVLSNRVESSSPFVLDLFWADPFGGAANDYDLYILNGTLTTVLDASTDVQDGDDDPIETTFPGAFAGERVVVVRFSGERRALHLNNFGGQFGIATSGSTHGHNSAVDAFGVAAVNAATASGGPFIGGATNPIELFSSDGFRRVFFDSAGTAYKPGKFLFGNNGGQQRKKPDVTAADGVQTSTPGFAPFFGTSAAAPHAAAIAGLIKSARPNLKPGRIRTALTRSALDIEAFGRDRDSGFGILDAFAALSDINAPPSPFLDLGTITSAVVGGDGDAFIEPGESASLQAELVNLGGATALSVHGQIATTTPGVTIDTAQSDYPNIGSNGQVAVNITPFRFSLAPTAVCGVAPEFAFTATYANGNNSPQVFSFRVPTGAPGSTPTTTSYTNPVVPIPDASAAGVSIPFTVSGVPGTIADVSFSIDGAMCSAVEGATTVGLDHTWVGDLEMRLVSPSGKVVTLASRPGGPLNSGNNFCQTVLNDDAATSIQAIAPSGAPYTGSFKPASPLAALKGETANGTWTLFVSDQAAFDIGSVRAFSLTLTPYVCN